MNVRERQTGIGFVSFLLGGAFRLNPTRKSDPVKFQLPVWTFAPFGSRAVCSVVPTPLYKQIVQ